MKTFNRLFLASLITTLSVANVYAFDKNDIEQIHYLWISNFAVADTHTLVRLYAEDAVMFPPSSEIVEGRTGIENYLNGLKEVGFKDYTLSTIDMEFKNDLAYETAIWETTRVDEDGNTITLQGNMSNVFKKQDDGSWKITMQIWI